MFLLPSSRSADIRLSLFTLPSFQVFGLTVLFGLFHGLVLLPVLLNLLGPNLDAKESTERNKEVAGITNSNFEPTNEKI